MKQLKALPPIVAFNPDAITPKHSNAFLENNNYMQWWHILLIVAGLIALLLLLTALLYKPFFKRFWDIFFGIIIGSIAIPILLLAMLFVYLVSPKSGSPIFKQVRVGRNGKEFTMLKLRTMTNDKNENGEFLPDEQRLKWWGKIIRKTNIDELTQILHILSGQKMGWTPA